MTDVLAVSTILARYTFHKIAKIAQVDMDELCQEAALWLLENLSDEDGDAGENDLVGAWCVSFYRHALDTYPALAAPVSYSRYRESDSDRVKAAKSAARFAMEVDDEIVGAEETEQEVFMRRLQEHSVQLWIEKNAPVLAYRFGYSKIMPEAWAKGRTVRAYMGVLEIRALVAAHGQKLTASERAQIEKWISNDLVTRGPVQKVRQCRRTKPTAWSSATRCKAA